MRRRVSWCFMGTPPPIEQANLGMADSLLLMVLALVVFGPRRLPQIGRQVGKLMYEFRKASNDFKFQMEEELRNAEEADRRKREEAERQQKLALAAPAQAAETKTDAQPADSGPAAPAAGLAAPAIESSPPASEPRTEETNPRILPPSTGETVAAARPGSVANGSAEPAQAAEKTASESAPEADESHVVTEQATHNG
jgi:sec-independent protein translocase protein TatB